MPEPTIHSIDDYETYLQNTLADLHPEQRTAFAAGMAERCLPIYAAFSKAEDWGDPASMRRALDAVWEHLRGQSLAARDLNRYSGLVQDSTPHMDDFDAEEALAAAVLVDQALACCRSADNVGPAIQAAMSGFEAVLPGWSDDPGDQLRLWQKSAVRKEFSQQIWLIERVRGIARFDNNTIQTLRRELTHSDHAVKVPKRKAPAGPPRLTNQTLFEQYRRMIEADIKSNNRYAGSLDQLTGLKTTLLFTQWSARYSRRRQTIDGSYGVPADTAAQRALVVRSRANDAALTGSPAWDPELRQTIDRIMQNPLMQLDVRSPEEPHGYGPSARRLWIEAKNRGLSDLGAWEQVAAWAQHRPTAWEMEDRRKKKGRAQPATGLTAQLARPVTWANTADPFYPWSAEVDGQKWQVGLNDFPDDYMYSLWIDSQNQGSFHDWPETWRRE